MEQGSVVKLSPVNSGTVLNRLRLMPLCLALGFFTSNAWANELLTKAETPKTIVVLGDSLAAGYGLDPSESFPALLQKEVDAAGMKFTVVNAGDLSFDRRHRRRISLTTVASRGFCALR